MRCELEGGDPPELVATDTRGNVLRVGVGGWEPVQSVRPDDEWGDLARVGRTTAVELPPVVLLIATDGTVRESVTVGTGPCTFEGPVTIRVDAAVRGRIVVPDGAVRIEPIDQRNAFRVQLDGTAPVRIAFDSRVPTDTQEVAVPATPDGVAQALSTAHRSITARSPDRTWPSLRSRTATVTVGEESSVPSSLTTPDEPEIAIHAPPDPATLLPLAPVAAYLGAVVRVDTSPVRIVADGTTWRIDPPDARSGEPQRAYERAVHGHLERAFWLDCLAREAGDVADEHRRSAFLTDHGLSADELYEASMAERLRAYDDVPVAAVRSTFPDWHYAISVRPRIESVETLGHRLHRLPLVHVADGEELSEVETVARAMEADSRSGDPPGPQMVEPNPTPARTHAWAGDGVPLGGWKLLDGDGTRDPTRSSSDSLEVVVVTNDRAMREEQVGATEQYDRRSDDLGIDVRTKVETTPATLARILEGDADLVHYIGHHDTDDGLRCRGGHLSADQLAGSDVRTFFLNACGSYEFAAALIRKGAEAGVATTTGVVDETATDLGVTWSRLLTYGWPVVTAMRYARRAADKPFLNYSVVGEGTTTVAQSDVHLQPMVEIDPIAENRWRVEMTRDHPVHHGGQATTPTHEGWWLPGSGRVDVLDTEELRHVLDRVDDPVIVDGTIRWPGNRNWIEQAEG